MKLSKLFKISNIYIIWNVDKFVYYSKWSTLFGIRFFDLYYNNLTLEPSMLSNVIDTRFLITNSFRWILATKSFNKWFGFSRYLIRKLDATNLYTLKSVANGLMIVPVNTTQNSFINCKIVFGSKRRSFGQQLKNKNTEWPVISGNIMTSIGDDFY